MQTEIWKTIPNFSSYEASTFGNIRNEKKVHLSQKPNHNGYIEHNIKDDDGKFQHRKSHRLIAITFIENPENKATVNHINHDRKDNRVENLEWATSQEQNQHRRKPLNVKSTYRYELKNDTGELNKFENEMWKPIPADIVNGIKSYSVSSHGRIMNSNKYGRICEGSVGTDGYKVVKVGRKNYLFHVLIAKVFLPNFYGKSQVNHKDGNRMNTKLFNLEWVRIEYMRLI